MSLSIVIVLHMQLTVVLVAIGGAVSLATMKLKLSGLKSLVIAGGE